MQFKEIWSMEMTVHSFIAVVFLFLFQQLKSYGVKVKE